MSNIKETFNKHSKKIYSVLAGLAVVYLGVELSTEQLMVLGQFVELEELFKGVIDYVTAKDE